MTSILTLLLHSAITLGDLVICMNCPSKPWDSQCFHHLSFTHHRLLSTSATPGHGLSLASRLKFSTAQILISKDWLWPLILPSLTELFVPHFISGLISTSCSLYSLTCQPPLPFHSSCLAWIPWLIIRTVPLPVLYSLAILNFQVMHLISYFHILCVCVPVCMCTGAYFSIVSPQLFLAPHLCHGSLWAEYIFPDLPMLRLRLPRDLFWIMKCG